MKQSTSFKKKQFKVLVNDIDELLEHKAEFKKKTDFLFEKIQSISKDVDEKMSRVVADFD